MKSEKTTTEKSGLLGFWDLAFMGLGSVVGAGIVTYVGIAISWTGRSAWIAYAVAIVLGFLANLPLILMSSAARIKGGNYSFLATTLGEVGGGWYGVQQILNAFYFSTMALSLGNYMHAISPAIPVKGVAIFSLVLFALINLFGTSFMAKVQNVLTIILIFGLLMFGLYGMMNAQPGSFDFAAEDFFTDGPDGFMQAVMILMNSTTGYTLITSFSGSCKKPKTDLPLAMAIVPLFLVVLYCSVGFTMCNVLPIEQTANQPLTAVAQVIFSPVVFYLFVFSGPVMALATSLNSSFGIFERPMMQLTRDGWLPEILGNVNKYGIAWKYIIIFFFIGALPIVLDFDIGTIVSNFTFVSSIGYILVAIGIMRYPKTMEGAWENRAWRTPMWLFLAACWIALAIRVFMIWRSFQTANMTMLVASAACLLVMWLWCFYRKKTGKAHVEKSWELQ